MVIQRDIFTKNIFRVTLEKCVCVEISKQQAKACLQPWFNSERDTSATNLNGA